MRMRTDSASPYTQTQGTLSAEAMSMQKVHWAERIVVDPEIHHGEPCIRGTRIPVAVVLGGLAEGLTPQAVLHKYPAFTAEAIQACLAYAAEVIRAGEFLAPLGV
jgi:Uncharacterized conserved protein, COG2442